MDEQGLGGPEGTSGLADLRRICTGCDRKLPPEDFGWKDRQRGRRRARCRECMRAYQADWYRSNADRHRLSNRVARRSRYEANLALVHRLKRVACADCGLRHPPGVMDFDHVRGEKAHDIASNLWQLSEAALLRELSKCEVVCAVCHRLRTIRRLRP